MNKCQKVKTKLSHAQWTEPPSKDRPQRFFSGNCSHWRDQARELPLFLGGTQPRNYVKCFFSARAVSVNTRATVVGWNRMSA